MLEKLGAMAPLNTTRVEGQQQTLMQRMQASLDDPSTKPPPPGFDIKPIPPTPEGLIQEMIKIWWNGEFMQTMIFGDEEKLGAKPDEY